ncbi:MAG: type III-A CRISPR-associated protein Cas10/Csm1 [Desulfovibrionaceae bacterium]
MVDDLHLLNLAALLHDIGKFAQRAGRPCSSGLEQEYCPGGTTHRHVLYTDYFIEKTLPLPKALEPLRSRLARLASAHHRPDAGNLMEMCICEGDRLSSGGDRVAGKSGGTYRTARLESVFNVIGLRQKYTCNLRYRLMPIDDADAIFPVQAEEAARTDYAALWQRFEQELAGLPLEHGIVHYLHSVQSLLEKWTWCIPSSTYKTSADISLYDHSYTTACIAQALYAARVAGEKSRFILFGGELSGIQKFIFTAGENADRGAGKLLRARSFIIQMITRSLWMTLLRRCNLSDTARLMDAGGRFLLLLPATPAVRDAVAGVCREVERWLLDEYHGVLGVRTASLELEAADLEMKRFQKRFDAFNRLLDEAKLHPFRLLMQEGLSARLGFSSADYATYGECVACGLAPAVLTDDEERPLCRRCAALISDVGRQLPAARYAILGRTSSQNPRPGGFPLFGGLHVLLCADEPTNKAAGAEDILSFRASGRFTGMPVAGYVPHISEADMERWKTEKRFPEDGDGLFWDDVRLRAGEPKTFGVLAQESRQKTRDGWRSVPMLAACKADVDNLGLLFSIGFGRDEERMLSVSRFAGLSRMMHRFFSAWLVGLVEREFPSVYVIFAGGDDLFVLGPWEQTVRFAVRMQMEFRRFSGDNPDVTLSAGLPLLKPGLPVFTMKEMAEELLEASKDFPASGDAADAERARDEKRPKNAVTLFDVTCSWEAFAHTLECGERLEALCTEGCVSQGFVRRLLGYARECREFRRGDVAKGLYLSHMRYDMQRNCDERKISSDDLLWLKALPHATDFPDIRAGATWALYRTRRS